MATRKRRLSAEDRTYQQKMEADQEIMNKFFRIARAQRLERLAAAANTLHFDELERLVRWTEWLSFEAAERKAERLP